MLKENTVITLYPEDYVPAQCHSCWMKTGTRPWISWPP